MILTAKYIRLMKLLLCQNQEVSFPLSRYEMRLMHTKLFNSQSYFVILWFGMDDPGAVQIIVNFQMGERKI